MNLVLWVPLLRSLRRSSLTTPWSLELSHLWFLKSLTLVLLLVMPLPWFLDEPSQYSVLKAHVVFKYKRVFVPDRILCFGISWSRNLTLAS